MCNTMNRETFVELTGEDPEDMFGPDWENQMLALTEDEDEMLEEEELPDDDEDAGKDN